MSGQFQYTIILNGKEIAQDYCFDSESEAESKADFCIESLLQCGYEDQGFRFYDFKKIITKM